MESFINSLATGDVELTLPYSDYSETLNNLVNYNSELTYNPSSVSTSPSQGTTRLDISHKLPTKLSKNPSTYEKELRKLVLNLYSDKEIPMEEPIPSTDLPSLNKDPVMEGPQTKGASYGIAQRVSIPQPLNMMRLSEPQQDLSRSGSEQYLSLDNDVGQTEENGIQNLQELQGYLGKFQSSKQGTVVLVHKLTGTSAIFDKALLKHSFRFLTFIVQSGNRFWDFTPL